jgi:hypothetical protein
MCKNKTFVLLKLRKFFVKQLLIQRDVQGYILRNIAIPQLTTQYVFTR